MARKAKPITLKEAKEAYERLGTLQRAAAELGVGPQRLGAMLHDAGVLERKIETTDRSKQGYDDIDRGLRLIPGNKVLTPKGPRVISEVYPYHVIVRTKHGYRESFTKSSLLCCATLQAAGLEYREAREK